MRSSLGLDFFSSCSSKLEKATFLMVYLMWGMPFFGEFFTGTHLCIKNVELVFSHSTAWFIVFSLFLLSLKYINKRVRIVDYLVWILYGLLFLITPILYPINLEPLEDYSLKSVFSVFPFLFCGELIDIKRQFKPLAIISAVVLLWYSFYSLYYLQNKVGTFADQGIRQNMHYAYLVLPHVMMCLWYSLTHRRNVFFIFVSILGAFLLLSFGNRGSLLDFSIFFLSYVLFFVHSRRKYLIWAVLLIIVALVYYYLEDILIFFQVLFSDLGMSTRVLDAITDNTFFIGSSVDERNLFKDILWNAVGKAPFLGYGICGSWQFVDSYPHNLVLDLYISFGVFVGTLILAFLGVLSIKAYKATTCVEEKCFLLLLFVTGIFKLFISYTFIDNVETFLYVGYCLRLIRNKDSKSYDSSLSTALQDC